MTKVFYSLVSLVALVLCVATTIVAQSRIGVSLAEALDSSPNAKFRVAIYLSEKADLQELDIRMKLESVPIKNRPQLVKSALLEVASQSQTQLLSSVSGHFGVDLEELDPKQLWINNCMVITVNASMVEFLFDREDVALVDLETARMVRLFDPPKRINSGGEREPGAAEPGLLAIGAHHLWNMGYTGNNRIHYSIDTGVWPDHPAIDDQFLGNYVPLNQAWFGYDSETPVDKSSDHGTHTIGTSLGLDHDEEDTIGVAFNAYYIASDPVATSLATVKPLTDFMFAFEWAFDPDGDSTTTHDIPDVINNSWGYDVPINDELCESYASEMFTAIEVAGIANVMSAGNDGPGPMTIGIPHHINTGLVNTFTVGAVNAHDSNLPIANFSSRGPTICGGTGALEIKPEVVAPGVAVRSAIRNGEYDEYQGTSMAAPHVSGAVLLLREAFPNVSGEEILLALYNSAMDLGDVGEDNNYGNGMINVLEAYNLLSQVHTPTPPDSTGLDVAISSISMPELDLYCGQLISPEVKLTNAGTDTITEVTITYAVVGEADQVFDWTGSLASGESQTVTLNPITVTAAGWSELWVRSSIPGAPMEADVINNNRIARFDIRPQTDIPFFEDFETGQLHDGTWMVRNPDAHITWDTLQTGGLDWSQYSVQLDFRHYNPIDGQKDELISPLITLPGSDAATLRFEMSYSFVHEIFSDSLEVLISTDCGYTWQSEYLNGGEPFGLPDSITDGDNDFIPTLPEHWRTEEIDLSGYMGEDILINFKTTNDRGSHLVIDNIRVYTAEDPAGLVVNDNPEVHLYPNPAGSVVRIESDIEFVSDLKVVDLFGRVLSSLSRARVSHQGIQLDLSNLNPGSYFVVMNSKDVKLVRPLVIAR